MKHYVVAIKDSALQAYMRPWYAPTPQAAIRTFSDEVNRKAADNQLNAHPEDFELWMIAIFEDEGGQFAQTDENYRCLMRGKDAIAK